MINDIGGSSHQSYSSSSSDEDNGTMMNNLIAQQQQQEEDLMYRMICNNNTIIAYYEYQLQHQVSHRGLIAGHKVIRRNREDADHNLFNDYFSDNPRYGDDIFRRRYQMSRNLFMRIVDAVKQHDSYFQHRIDAIGRCGLSTLQKVTAVFRMLAYGLPADATDEYVKIGESTAIESMKRFCRAIVEIFAEQYLRSPTASDIARLLHVGEQRGFSGMLGILDCMH